MVRKSTGLLIVFVYLLIHFTSAQALNSAVAFGYSLYKEGENDRAADFFKTSGRERRPAGSLCDGLNYTGRLQIQGWHQARHQLVWQIIARRF